MNIKILLNYQKLISVITATCLLISFVIGPMAASAINNEQKTKEYNQIFKEFILPYSYGKITKSHFAGTDRVIINIQDLHCHPKVQKNIANIIETFDKKFGVKKIYLEGAYGDVDTKWIADKTNNNKNIIEQMLDTGRLTGAEYYSALSGKADLIKGLEEKEPYLDNIKRLGKILQNQEKINLILNSLHDCTDKVKRKYYTKRQYKLEKLFNEYKEGKIPSQKYYALLSKHIDKLGVDLTKYENTLIYITLLELQKDLNYKQITKELQSLILILKQQLPYNAYKSLLENTENFKEIEKFYSYIVQLDKIFSFDIPLNFKELDKYFRYVELTKKINPVELIKEDELLVQEINTRFSQTKAQQEIVFFTCFEKYLIDYLTTKITPGDYEYYKNNIDKYIQIYNKYVDNRVLSLLDEYVSETDKFYNINLDRNIYFTKHIFKENEFLNKIENPKQAKDDINKIIDNMNQVKDLDIVVTGGFHSQTVTELLEKQNVSYIVITPNVTDGIKLAEDTYYELAREQSKISFQTIAPVIASLSPQLQKILLEKTDKTQKEEIDKIISLNDTERAKIISELAAAKLLESDDIGAVEEKLQEIVETIVGDYKEKIKITPELISQIKDLQKLLKDTKKLKKVIDLLSKESSAKQALYVLLDMYELVYTNLEPLLSFVEEESKIEKNQKDIHSLQSKRTKEKLDKFGTNFKFTTLGVAIGVFMETFSFWKIFSIHINLFGKEINIKSFIQEHENPTVVQKITVWTIRALSIGIGLGTGSVFALLIAETITHYVWNLIVIHKGRQDLLLQTSKGKSEFENITIPTQETKEEKGRDLSSDEIAKYERFLQKTILQNDIQYQYQPNPELKKDIEEIFTNLLDAMVEQGKITLAERQQYRIHYYFSPIANAYTIINSKDVFIFSELLYELSEQMRKEGNELTKDHIAAILAHELQHTIQENRVYNGYNAVQGDNKRKEYDADRESIFILEQAGYNPRAVEQMMSALISLSSTNVLKAFFDAHPNTEDRLKEISEILENPSLVFLSMSTKQQPISVSGISKYGQDIEEYIEANFNKGTNSSYSLDGTSLQKIFNETNFFEQISIFNISKYINFSNKTTKDFIFNNILNGNYKFFTKTENEFIKNCNNEEKEFIYVLLFLSSSYENNIIEKLENKQKKNLFDFCINILEPEKIKNQSLIISLVVSMNSTEQDLKKFLAFRIDNNKKISFYSKETVYFYLINYKFLDRSELAALLEELIPHDRFSSLFQNNDEYKLSSLFESLNQDQKNESIKMILKILSENKDLNLLCSDPMGFINFVTESDVLTKQEKFEYLLKLSKYIRNYKKEFSNILLDLFDELYSDKTNVEKLLHLFDVLNKSENIYYFTEMLSYDDLITRYDISDIDFDVEELKNFALSIKNFATKFDVFFLGYFLKLKNKDVKFYFVRDEETAHNKKYSDGVCLYPNINIESLNMDLLKNITLNDLIYFQNFMMSNNYYCQNVSLLAGFVVDKILNLDYTDKIKLKKLLTLLPQRKTTISINGDISEIPYEYLKNLFDIQVSYKDINEQIKNMPVSSTNFVNFYIPFLEFKMFQPNYFEIPFEQSVENIKKHFDAYSYFKEFETAEEEGKQIFYSENEGIGNPDVAEKQIKNMEIEKAWLVELHRIFGLKPEEKNIECRYGEENFIYTYFKINECLFNDMTIIPTAQQAQQLINSFSIIKKELSQETVEIYAKLIYSLLKRNPNLSVFYSANNNLELLDLLFEDFSVVKDDYIRELLDNYNVTVEEYKKIISKTKLYFFSLNSEDNNKDVSGMEMINTILPTLSDSEKIKFFFWLLSGNDQYKPQMLKQVRIVNADYDGDIDFSSLQQSFRLMTKTERENFIRKILLGKSGILEKGKANAERNGKEFEKGLKNILFDDFFISSLGNSKIKASSISIVFKEVFSIVFNNLSDERKVLFVNNLLSALAEIKNNNENTDEENARQLGRLIVALGTSSGVAVVKLLQILSNNKVFEALDDKYGPIINEEVAKVKNENEPLSKSVLFQYLEKIGISSAIEYVGKRLGSASIGLTYLLKLKNMSEVVVAKIKRPNINKNYSEDFGIADKILEYFKSDESLLPEVYKKTLPASDKLRALFDEELEFEKESDNLEKFNEQLKKRNSKIKVSQLIHTINGTKVYNQNLFLQTMAKGKTLDKINVSKKQKSKIYFDILKEFFTEIFVDPIENGQALYHADLHTGNIFVDEQGNISFIDLGGVGKVSAQQSKALKDIFMYLYSGKYNDFINALKSYNSELYKDLEQGKVLSKIAEILNRKTSLESKFVDLFEIFNSLKNIDSSFMMFIQAISKISAYLDNLDKKEQLLLLNNLNFERGIKFKIIMDNILTYIISMFKNIHIVKKQKEVENHEFTQEEIFREKLLSNYPNMSSEDIDLLLSLDSVVLEYIRNNTVSLTQQQLIRCGILADELYKKKIITEQNNKMNLLFRIISTTSFSDKNIEKLLNLDENTIEKIISEIMEDEKIEILFTKAEQLNIDLIYKNTGYRSENRNFDRLLMFAKGDTLKDDNLSFYFYSIESELEKVKLLFSLPVHFTKMLLENEDKLNFLFQIVSEADLSVYDDFDIIDIIMSLNKEECDNIDFNVRTLSNNGKKYVRRFFYLYKDYKNVFSKKEDIKTIISFIINNENDSQIRELFNLAKNKDTIEFIAKQRINYNKSFASESILGIILFRCKLLNIDIDKNNSYFIDMINALKFITSEGQERISNLDEDTYRKFLSIKDNDNFIKLLKYISKSGYYEFYDEKEFKKLVNELTPKQEERDFSKYLKINGFEIIRQKFEDALEYLKNNDYEITEDTYKYIQYFLYLSAVDVGWMISYKFEFFKNFFDLNDSSKKFIYDFCKQNESTIKGNPNAISIIINIAKDYDNNRFREEEFNTLLNLIIQLSDRIGPYVKDKDIHLTEILTNNRVSSFFLQYYLQNKKFFFDKEYKTLIAYLIFSEGTNIEHYANQTYSDNSNFDNELKMLFESMVEHNIHDLNMFYNGLTMKIYFHPILKKLLEQEYNKNNENLTPLIRYRVALVIAQNLYVHLGEKVNLLNENDINKIMSECVQDIIDKKNLLKQIFLFSDESDFSGDESDNSNISLKEGKDFGVNKGRASNTGLIGISNSELDETGARYFSLSGVGSVLNFIENKPRLLMNLEIEGSNDAKEKKEKLLKMIEEYIYLKRKYGLSNLVVVINGHGDDYNIYLNGKEYEITRTELAKALLQAYKNGANLEEITLNLAACSSYAFCENLFETLKSFESAENLEIKLPNIITEAGKEIKPGFGKKIVFKKNVTDTKRITIYIGNAIYSLFMYVKNKIANNEFVSKYLTLNDVFDSEMYNSNHTIFISGQDVEKINTNFRKRLFDLLGEDFIKEDEIEKTIKTAQMQLPSTQKILNKFGEHFRFTKLGVALGCIIEIFSFWGSDFIKNHKFDPSIQAKMIAVVWVIRALSIGIGLGTGIGLFAVICNPLFGFFGIPALFLTEIVLHFIWNINNIPEILELKESINPIDVEQEVINTGLSQDFIDMVNQNSADKGFISLYDAYRMGRQKNKVRRTLKGKEKIIKNNGYALGLTNYYLGDGKLFEPVWGISDSENGINLCTYSDGYYEFQQDGTRIRTNKQYLEKIFKDCENNNKEVYFFLPPNINSFNAQNMQKAQQEYMKEHPELQQSVSGLGTYQPGITKEEINWLKANPQYMKYVHFVVGSYTFLDENIDKTIFQKYFNINNISKTFASILSAPRKYMKAGHNLILQMKQTQAEINYDKRDVVTVLLITKDDGTQYSVRLALKRITEDDKTKQDYIKTGVSDRKMFVYLSSINDDAFSIATSKYTTIEYIERITGVKIEVSKNTIVAKSDDPKTQITFVKNREISKNVSSLTPEQIPAIEQQEQSDVENIAKAEVTEIIYLDESSQEIERKFKHAIENNSLIVIYPFSTTYNLDSLTDEQLYSLYFNIQDKFFELQEMLDKYLPGIDDNRSMAYILKEFIKNAFVHGNLSNPSIPIYIKFIKNGFTVINEAEVIKNEQTRLKRLNLSAAATLTGAHRGLQIIRAYEEAGLINLDQEITTKEIVDENGEKKKVSYYIVTAVRTFENNEIRTEINFNSLIERVFEIIPLIEKTNNKYPNDRAKGMTEAEEILTQTFTPEELEIIDLLASTIFDSIKYVNSTRNTSAVEFVNIIYSLQNGLFNDNLLITEGDLKQHILNMLKHYVEISKQKKGEENILVKTVENNENILDDMANFLNNIIVKNNLIQKAKQKREQRRKNISKFIEGVRKDDTAYSAIMICSANENRSAIWHIMFEDFLKRTKRTMTKVFSAGVFYDISQEVIRQTGKARVLRDDYHETLSFDDRYKGIDESIKSDFRSTYIKYLKVPKGTQQVFIVAGEQHRAQLIKLGYDPSWIFLMSEFYSDDFKTDFKQTHESLGKEMEENNIFSMSEFPDPFEEQILRQDLPELVKSLVEYVFKTRDDIIKENLPERFVKFTDDFNQFEHMEDLPYFASDGGYEEKRQREKREATRELYEDEILDLVREKHQFEFRANTKYLYILQNRNNKDVMLDIVLSEDSDLKFKLFALMYLVGMRRNMTQEELNSMAVAKDKMITELKKQIETNSFNVLNNFDLRAYMMGIYLMLQDDSLNKPIPEIISNAFIINKGDKILADSHGYFGVVDLFTIIHELAHVVVLKPDFYNDLARETIGELVSYITPNMFLSIVKLSLKAYSKLQTGYYTIHQTNGLIDYVKMGKKLHVLYNLFSEKTADFNLKQKEHSAPIAFLELLFNAHMKIGKTVYWSDLFETIKMMGNKPLNQSSMFSEILNEYTKILVSKGKLSKQEVYDLIKEIEKMQMWTLLTYDIVQNIKVNDPDTYNKILGNKENKAFEEQILSNPANTKEYINTISNIIKSKEQLSRNDILTLLIIDVISNIDYEQLINNFDGVIEGIMNAVRIAAQIFDMQKEIYSLSEYEQIKNYVTDNYNITQNSNISIIGNIFDFIANSLDKLFFAKLLLNQVFGTKNLSNILKDKKLLIVTSKQQEENLQQVLKNNNVEDIKIVTMEIKTEPVSDIRSDMVLDVQRGIKVKYDTKENKLIVYSKQGIDISTEDIKELIMQEYFAERSEDIIDKDVIAFADATDTTFDDITNRLKTSYTASVTMPNKEQRFDLSSKPISNIIISCKQEFSATGIKTFTINREQAENFVSEIKSLQEEGFRFIISCKSDNILDITIYDGLVIDATKITDINQAMKFMDSIKKKVLIQGIAKQISVEFNDDIYIQFDNLKRNIMDKYGIMPLIDANSQSINLKNIGKYEVKNVTENNIDNLLRNNSVIGLVIDNARVLIGKKSIIKQLFSKEHKYNKGYNASLSSKFDYICYDVSALAELLNIDINNEKDLNKLKNLDLSKLSLSSDSLTYLEYLQKKANYEEMAGFIKGIVMNTARVQIIKELKEKGIELDVDKFAKESNGKYQKAFLTVAVQLMIEDIDITKLLETDFIDSDMTTKQYLDSVYEKVNINIEDILKQNEYKIQRTENTAKTIEDFKNYVVLLDNLKIVKETTANFDMSIKAVRNMLAAA